MTFERNTVTEFAAIEKFNGSYNVAILLADGEIRGYRDVPEEQTIQLAVLGRGAIADAFWDENFRGKYNEASFDSVEDLKFED